MTIAALTSGSRTVATRHGLAAGATAMLLAALTMNQVIAGRLLDALGANVSVAGVLAIGMTVYAACRCMWHWRSPVLRALGTVLFFFSAYELNVVVSYMPASGSWDLFGQILWPAIPLAYAAWGSAALAIARVARGEPVGWASDWASYGLTGRFWRQRLTPRPSHVWLWLPALAFSALSLVPGIVYSGTAVPGVSWQGQPYEPHLTYAIISAWGIVTLVGSSAVIGAAWMQQRPDLGASDRLLVRGGVRLSMYAVVCATVLAAGAITGFWPEPVIDLVIATFTVVYVSILTADNAHRSDVDIVPLSVHNLVISAGVISLSAFMALATTRSPAPRGLYDAGFTVALTFLILTVIHVVRRPGTGTNAKRGLDRLTDDGRERLLTLLDAVDERLLRLYVNSLPLRGVAASEPNNLRPDDQSGLPVFRSELRRVLGSASDSEFLRIVYETSLTIPDLPDPRRPHDPTPIRVTRVQCHRRAEVTDDLDELAELEVAELQLMVDAKRRGEVGDGLPNLRFRGEIDTKTRNELVEMLAKLEGRADGGKSRRRALLESGLKNVRAALLKQRR